MNPFSSAFTATMQAISNVFAWLAKRSDQNNTPAMQAGKTNQLEANAEAKTAKAIAGQDEKEMRNELAE